MVQGGSEQSLGQGGDGRRGDASHRSGDPYWERRLREGPMSKAPNFPSGTVRRGWG